MKLKLNTMPIIVGLLTLLLAIGCQMQEPAQEDPRQEERTESARVDPTATKLRPTEPGATTPSVNTPTPTPEPEDSPFGKHAVLPKQTPTPTPEPTAAPTPIPNTQIEQQLDLQYDDALERCRFWAHTEGNINGPTWVEFTQLNPQRMTDLQRSLWRNLLGENSYCWPYFAERLSVANADKRNWQFQAECLTEINNLKNRFYENAGSYIREEQGHPQTINQYARVMNFLELTGEELLEAEVKPWELYLKLRYGKNYNPAQIIIERLAGGDYDYRLLRPNTSSSGTTVSPYESGETPIPEEWLHSSSGYTPTNIDYSEYTSEQVKPGELTLEQVEWYGFGYAFTRIGACKVYYPQIYTGYWIPIDSGGGAIKPVPELEGERSLLIPSRYRRQQ